MASDKLRETVRGLILDDHISGDTAAILSRKSTELERCLMLVECPLFFSEQARALDAMLRFDFHDDEPLPFRLKKSPLYAAAAEAVESGELPFKESKGSLRGEVLDFLDWATREEWPLVEPEPGRSMLLQAFQEERERAAREEKEAPIEMTEPYTELEEKIMQGLREHAMTAKALMQYLDNNGCPRDDSTVKRALQGLRLSGLIQNRRGLGYYLLS